MVLYKDSKYFQTSDNQAFDRIFTPGTATPHSGIYRCEGCGHNITDVAEPGRKLPPQNSHQHTNQLVPIRWRLVASHS